ncbi:MAG: sortase [Oscillospiraceae bacterium]|nr:sortase [Oscillospiraceae bacterium]
MRRNNAIKSSIKKYKILLIVLVATLIVIIGLMINRTMKYDSAEEQAQNILNAMAEIKVLDGNALEVAVENTKMDGHQVIGSIKIDSVGLEYPILDETTEATLALAITKLSGPDLNTNGNVTLAGHNNRNGKLFSKLPNVKVGDVIEITDMKNNTVQYKVYKTYTVDPTDISCTYTTDPNKKEITLITCTLGAIKRIVVKASEI